MTKKTTTEVTETDTPVVTTIADDFTWSPGESISYDYPKRSFTRYDWDDWMGTLMGTAFAAWMLMSVPVMAVGATFAVKSLLKVM